MELTDQADGYVIADVIRAVSMTPTQSAGLYYLHTDHLDTVQLISDQTGAIVWQGSQKPFGQTETLVNLVDNPLRFPGQYYDQETGLHYNYFRDYDPKTGRYVQSDPIGHVGGPNTYGYVGANPLYWSDLFGLMKLPANPSGLPPEWEPDSGHQDPNGERYRHPSGDFVDFHKGRPGERGWKGKDHWHHNGEKKHLNPGDEIPDPDEGESCGDQCQETAIAVGSGVGGAALIYFIVKKCVGAGLLFTPAAPLGGGLLVTP